MSETQTEEQAPAEEAPQVDVPEGWDVVHHKPEEIIVTSETQGEYRVIPAEIRAEKNVNGIMVNASGETPEQVTAAAEAIEASVAPDESLEPQGAPLAEPDPVMTMPIDPEQPEVAPEPVEVPPELTQPETVLTDQGAITEDEWAGRARTDHVLVAGENEGETEQIVYSGVGEQADQTAETADTIASDAATAEQEAKAEEPVETEQITYDTADAIDSPGQSAGGSLLVPADVETPEEAGAAMQEAQQAAEVDRVVTAEAGEAPADAPATDDQTTAVEEPEATPAAADKADELGVDLSTVEGTGAEGKILVSDVEQAAAEQPPAATDAAVAKADELGVDLTTVEGTGAGGNILVSDVEAAAADSSTETPPADS